MPARLIVNADDFGLTRGINQAIAELHAAGVVTSATLMATGPAFDHAVELAHEHPKLGVGCHVLLTDGVPVSPPETIRTLLGEDGRTLRPSLNEFMLAALRGKLDPAEIEREATAQIRVLQTAGIRVTHLDTHKHTHTLPQVARPLLAAAERTGVRAVRSPFEEPWSLHLGKTRSLRLLALMGTGLFRQGFRRLPQLRDGVVLTTQGTIGISATGRLNEATLRQIMAALPDGTWELVCHPGYNDADLDAVTTRLRETREIERQALLAVLSPLGHAVSSPHSHKDSQPRSPELINYGRL